MIITALANDEKPLIYVKIISFVRFGKFTRRPAIYKIHNMQKRLRKKKQNAALQMSFYDTIKTFSAVIALINITFTLFLCPHY